MVIVAWPSKDKSIGVKAKVVNKKGRSVAKEIFYKLKESEN